MDTKSKNIKYQLGTKIVAVILLWASVVVSLTCGIFLLVNAEVVRVDTYEATYDYRQIISRLVHNTVELGTKFKHGDQVFQDNERYMAISRNLAGAVNYNYYMTDLETGKVSFKGTDNLAQIQAEPGYMYIDKDDIPYDLYMLTDLKMMLEAAPQEIYISLNDPLIPGDVFYDEAKEFNTIKSIVPYVVWALTISVLVMFISLGYLVLVSGRKEKGGPVYLADIDRIYNDIQFFFLVGLAGVSMLLVSAAGLGRELYGPGLAVIILVFAVDAAAGITYFFSMLRQFKKGVLLKNTVVYKVLSTGVNMVKSLFSEKVFKVWIIGIMLAYGLINGILFSFALSYGRRFVFGSFLIMIFNLGAVYLAFNRLKSLTIIMNAAKEISTGNLEYQIDQSNMSMELASFAKDIQSIQGGLKNAVNEAIKGERMKTDLITNVSHDLKTPLTSIINYVDLLRQEEINNEVAKGYLEILDEKSYRLKQLIEDLIEASKASSGNISITKEAVDLHELVAQACGEYQEKIENAGLDFRINAPEEATIIEADGQYMWRIMENIMSNAIKYSMAKARVYIDIESVNGYGRLTMKNMSAYPLDIDPAQLTERFTRADQSRTTEGSGLGLSIAQSLTTIQDGRFNIEIDGDLFKVMIEMPLKVLS